MKLSQYSLIIGNPASALTAAANFLSPLRFVRFLVWPAAILAGTASYFNWHSLTSTLDRNFETFSFLQHLLLSMITTNLLTRLMMGVTMAANGVPPARFGIRLLLGVMPRFFVSTSTIQLLDFPQQRQCYAASILTRLAMFAVGILTWVVLRRGGSELADAALVLGAMGFGTFLLSVNPLWREAGYHWMAAWFRMPKLREQSYRLLGLLLRGKPLPETLGPQAIRGLFAYAIGSIVFTTAQLSIIVYTAAWKLEAEYSGAGVVLFSLLLSMMIAFLISRTSRKPRRGGGKFGEDDDETEEAQTTVLGDADEPDEAKNGSSGTRNMARNRTQRPRLAAVNNQPESNEDLDMLFDADPGDGAKGGGQATGSADPDLDEILSPLPAERAAPPRSEAPKASQSLDTVLKIGTAKPTRAAKLRKLAIWAAILGLLGFLAIQPYPFTVGGDFIVQPFERHQVRARTDGEIVKLNIIAGQWVKQNEVLAVLSNWDEARDVGLTQADLARLKADLATLTAGPKVEEIALAQEELKAAVTKVTQAQQELDRKKQLFKSKVVPLKDLEEAQNAYDFAVTGRGQAQAKLDLLNAPALSSEVDSARANIQRKEEEVAYNKLQLENTYVRAPITGQVITTMDNVSVGSYLREGDLVAELADQRTVMVEIEVPETDVNNSNIGASVILKLWSAPDESITGTVTRISPIAEERDFGRVVRVTVEVPNPDGKLTRNMTGYGKIIVGDRPVWEVFTRVFVRFFLIEMWSWLP